MRKSCSRRSREQLQLLECQLLMKVNRTALIFNSVVTGHILSARSVLFAFKFVMSKL